MCHWVSSVHNGTPTDGAQGYAWMIKIIAFPLVSNVDQQDMSQLECMNMCLLIGFTVKGLQGTVLKDMHIINGNSSSCPLHEIT